MTAVVGKALGWVRSWGSRAVPKKTTVVIVEDQKSACSRWTLGGWTSWIWGGQKSQSDQSNTAEEFWEAQEKLQPMEIEDLHAGKQDTVVDSGQVSRWWHKYIPTYYFWYPRKTEPKLKERKYEGQSGSAWDHDVDGDFDFRTPPPSPTPPYLRLPSPFRLFSDSWKVEILPEHYEICFNFLRHLFDLFVVGFLRTVSHPAKLILEVFGVQGPLRLWIHGMAMFLVSTVGMAGLLWLIQEYLPQFALIYGIIQGVVISVSVRQSVMTGMEEENKEINMEGKETNETTDCRDRKEELSAKKKTS